MSAQFRVLAIPALALFVGACGFLRKVGSVITPPAPVWESSIGDTVPVCVNLREVLTSRYSMAKEERGLFSKRTITSDAERVNLTDAVLRTLVASREACAMFAAGKINAERFGDLLVMITASESYVELMAQGARERNTELQRLLNEAVRIWTAQNATHGQASSSTADSIRNAQVANLLEKLSTRIAQEIALASAERERARVRDTVFLGTTSLSEDLRRIADIRRELDDAIGRLATSSPPWRSPVEAMTVIDSSVTVSFSTGSAVLSDEATRRLASLEMYRTLPVSFSIVGRASSIGSVKSNLQLSSDRAAAVERWLVGILGVPPARITTAALGAFPPAAVPASAQRAVVYVLALPQQK